MNETIYCLFVDDDLDDQEIFMMALEKVSRTIKCNTANNGAEALSLLAQNDQIIPDYIFLDVNMPKMNGIECLQNLSDIQRLKDCIIFMYSTSSEQSVIRKCMELGAKDFIVKPASISELEKILCGIFEN